MDSDSTVTRLIKARAHPLRRMILLTLMAEGDQAATLSPNELAKATGEPLGNVSYHVQALIKVDLIELSHTEPRRGAVEHFYRAGPGLTKEVEDSIALDLLGELLERTDNGTVKTVEVAEIVRSTGRTIKLACEAA